MCDRLVKYSEAVAVLAPRVGSRDGAKRLLRENRVVPCVPPERHGLHGQKLWRLKELEAVVERLVVGKAE